MHAQLSARLPPLRPCELLLMSERPARQHQPPRRPLDDGFEVASASSEVLPAKLPQKRSSNRAAPGSSKRRQQPAQLQSAPGPPNKSRKPKSPKLSVSLSPESAASKKKALKQPDAGSSSASPAPAQLASKPAPPLQFTHVQSGISISMSLNQPLDPSSDAATSKSNSVRAIGQVLSSVAPPPPMLPRQTTSATTNTDLALPDSIPPVKRGRKRSGYNVFYSGLFLFCFACCHFAFALCRNF